MTEPAERDEGRRDRRVALALMAVAILSIFAYEAAVVPRLTNAHFGDVEFTGWSGPLGSRLLRGDRPYVDFVLPIPPGSFLLLAALEKLSGRPLLLHELWLDAAMHLVMGVLAYFIARTFTSRRTSVFVAVATLLTVIQLNKECAYDHTAQAVAWASLLAGMRALFGPDPSGRSRLWLLAGLLSGGALLFKQSTAIGAILGWLVAFFYLASVEVFSGRPPRASDFRLPSARYLQGVGLGLGLVWGVLVLLGSTFRAFFQAVFLDGSVLKGGFRFLVKNLVVYLFDFPAYPASLALLATFVMIGARWVRLEGPSLHVGDEPARAGRFSGWEIAGLTAMLAGASGAAVWFLLRGPPGYPSEWIVGFDRFKFWPTVALVPLCVLFVAHLVRAESPAPSAGAAADPRRSGHSWNAAVLAGLVSSLFHNTSAPEFRPFYDNNAIIPLAFVSLFVVLERARLRPLALVYLLGVTASVGGNKYFRATTATTRVDPELHWAGMRVNDHGNTIVQVATRVRALTRAEDTVLVLPEDVQMAALIGRPRPPLIGAILFVDQYPPRLAADDIARLSENPPKVIVVHPRQVPAWQKFFRIWSGTSGAERVIHHVLGRLIPARYERDSSYETMFLWEAAHLDVYVRRDPAALAPLEP